MRISTTTLESFRLWSDPDQEWMTEAELQANIRGEFVPTRKVLIGKAFGRVLEHPEPYRVRGGFLCDGYSFDDATMREPLALMDRRGVFEAKGVKSYGPYDVVAKADHILGVRLSEFKTTDYFDFDKYEASYQWRFMTDIFEPASITYHVFSLDDHDNGVVSLKEINTFTLYPYGNVHVDCCDLLERFVAYVNAKGLEGILRARQKEAAA